MSLYREVQQNRSRNTTGSSLAKFFEAWVEPEIKGIVGESDHVYEFYCELILSKILLTLPKRPDICQFMIDNNLNVIALRGMYKRFRNSANKSRGKLHVH